MTSNDFYDQQKQAQIKWREGNNISPEWGWQNGKRYEHIVSRNLWRNTLWSGIKEELTDYLSGTKIQSHTGTHNLLSSWVLSASLYFPVRVYPEFKQLMLKFLQENIAAEIESIEKTELEYALDGDLSPENLLGEAGGIRGSGQTSPDVAFEVKTPNGEGLVLTECKFTEHNFYPCSARSRTGSQEKPANPDPQRCMHEAKDYIYRNICQQTKWGRKYLELLSLSEYGKDVLKRCPASTGGYQLLRQQALAEGIATSGKYAMVVSSVAFDERNLSLKNCLRSTGISNFTAEWGKIFEGKTIFKTWTHQQWVNFVRNNETSSRGKEWEEYLRLRYGY
jgi:hypothetical protein